MTSSQNVMVAVNRPADVVYQYASDPANISDWAAGLAGTPLENVDGKWVADSPMGRISIEFSEQNPLGVLDHIVTLPSGDQVLNPMRVIPDGPDRCEVIFTIRRRDMSDDEFAADMKAIETDLGTLKEICESKGS